MKKIIALEVAAKLSEKGFFLDELVIKAKELFNKEGIAGFVSLLLMLVDSALCSGLVKGEIDQRTGLCCCENCSYEHVHLAKKEFRTSVGVVKIKWRRLRCRNCKKTSFRYESCWR